MTLLEPTDQPEAPNVANCRFCETPLHDRFIDVSWSFDQKQMYQFKKDGKAPFNHLPTYVCPQCFLIQVPEYPQPEPEGPFYTSSFSGSWLGDLKQFSDRVFSKLEITDHGIAAELACHNEELQGGLTFQRGLSSFIETYGKANLIITHDELAHIQDLNGFLSAVRLFLSPNGIITFEFLHLIEFMEGANSEVLFSRYFPYFSLTTWDRMLTKYGMVIFDVEACQPKGSLRIYAKHATNPVNKISAHVRFLRGNERDRGICSLSTYRRYKAKSQPQPHFVSRAAEPAVEITQKFILHTSSLIQAKI